MEDELIIIGRNTVREAIKSGRSIDQLLVAEDAKDGSIGEIVSLAKKAGINITRVPKNKLDVLSEPFGYGGRPGNHQGVAAKVSGVEYAEVDDIFAAAEAKGEAPFIVALDGITDPQNLGAIVRSAECMGAHGVIIPKRRSAGMNAAACKTASGAEEHIAIARVVNLARTIDELKERGVWVAAADMGGEAPAKLNLKGTLCIVIGSEGEGVSRLVAEKADMIVGIPMKGKVSSLNASAAAAILFYEKLRQDNA